MPDYDFYQSVVDGSEPIDDETWAKLPMTYGYFTHKGMFSFGGMEQMSDDVLDADQIKLRDRRKQFLETQEMERRARSCTSTFEFVARPAHECNCPDCEIYDPGAEARTSYCHEAPGHALPHRDGNIMWLDDGYQVSYVYQ